MVWLTQHVARFGWFSRNAKVILQVKDKHDSPWRDARLQDLTEIEESKDRWAKRKKACGDMFFPTGIRVVSSQRSGFHKGAHGVVEFQEPTSGRVWVTRDGSGGPLWFMADELDYENGVFTPPKRRGLTFYDGEYTGWWWIANGHKVAAWKAEEWCQENGVEQGEYMIRCLGDDPNDPSAFLFGFKDSGNATLFYMRFR